MAVGDVLPQRNLPNEAEPWGRALETMVKEIAETLDGTQTRVINANRAGALALDATASQGGQIVEVKETAVAADAKAETVKTDLAVVKETAVVAEQIASTNNQPGTNVFDTAPIVDQNIEGYSTVNLTGYNWLADGIQVQTPPNNAGVNVVMLEPVRVKPGDVLTASVLMEWSETAAGPPITTVDPPYLGYGGFGLSFYNADGSVQSASTSIGWQNQPGLQRGQFTVPAGAVFVKINLFAYIPTNGSYIGYDDPDRQVWVKFRRPYVGVLVGTDGIADGAVTQDKLDPSITFGVADDSLTTEKYQNLSVTDAKIAGPIDASKVGSGYAITDTTGTLPANRVATIPITTGTTGSLPTSRLSGTVATSQIADFAVNLNKVDSTVRNRMFYSGLFDYSNPLRGTGTYVEAVGNVTWWAVALPSSGYSGITVENTLNDGSPANYTGNRIYAPVSGKYLMMATAGFYNSSGGSARAIAFQVGNSATGNRKGQSVSRYSPMPNADLWANSSAIVKANAGDMLSVVVRQDSGGNLSCSIESLQVIYLGPA